MKRRTIAKRQTLKQQMDDLIAAQLALSERVENAIVRMERLRSDVFSLLIKYTYTLCGVPK